MATVVLTAVGTLIGGPIGGAIGAALGQRIDSAVFSPKPREGPRIKELDVQTSSYGTQIPAIFGAMRVAGTVIWSTDLIERKVKSGGGKGRPSTVNYSYSASFAVALSSRPVARIGRIWADGNLLRGSAGDFKVETEFRFHAGHADQPLDPLLASAETTGQCPAHRGLAYAVFEDLQLADFGNRIPSLTFEIFERDSAVPVLDIAIAASNASIVGQSNEILGGYALQGSDCRAALSHILAALPVSVAPFDDKMRLVDWGAPTTAVAIPDLAIADGRTDLDRPQRSRGSASGAPTTVSIRHYDPERDYQAGVQKSRQQGTSRADQQLDLPASVNAPIARRFADTQLLQRWRSQNGFSVATPLRGDAFALGQDMLAEGRYRIIEIEHLRGTTRLVASQWADGAGGSLVADPGRNLPQADLMIGETRIIALDLPAFGSDDPGRPVVAITAAGTGAGWRRAALAMRDGDRWLDLGGTNGVAIMGALQAALPGHSALLEDRLNQPIIRLLHDAMVLPPGTGSALDADAPTVWITNEIIRYAHAEKIGARDYRLRGLLRGCFDTADSALIHAAGAAIALIEPDALMILDSSTAPIGAPLELQAMGVADPAPAEASLVVPGNAVRPRAPVHGTINRSENGTISLQWARRERTVFSWSDAVDAPNSEGAIEFAVDLHVSSTLLQSWTVENQVLELTAAQLAQLGLHAGSTLVFAVSQIGRFARSRPLLLEIAI